MILRERLLSSSSSSSSRKKNHTLHPRFRRVAKLRAVEFGAKKGCEFRPIGSGMGSFVNVVLELVELV